MIQSTANLTGYYRSDALTNSPGQKTPALPTPAAPSDHLSSTNTDSLRQALSQTDEIRPHIVERGKALAIDPTYPPRQIIEDLAKLMINSRDLSANA